MTARNLTERPSWISRRRLLGLAIGSVFSIALGFLVSSPAAAGGYAFTAEVLEFQALGNDEYRIVIRQMPNPGGNDLGAPDPMVVHLRHDEDATREVSKDFVSKEKYLAAIELLKQQILQSPIIQLGVWGGGLTPIDGKPGEFSSYSLSIEEGVVYSWNGAID